MLSVTCDVHTHTLFSRHAYSTIEECVRTASERGVQLLGSTDHFGNMLFENPSFLDFQYFINRDLWPREWMGVTLLRGIEADIVDLEGHLYGWDHYISTNLTFDPAPTRTLLDFARKGSDFTIASIHGKHWAAGASAAQLTRMYVNVLEEPSVLILGHIGRSGLGFEIDPVVKAARDQHKLIEVNEHSFHYGESVGRCRAILERCAELGCQVSLATDAHIATDIGLMPRSLAMLEELDFPEELVASRAPQTFLAAIRAAGLPDPLANTGVKPEA